MGRRKAEPNRSSTDRRTKAYVRNDEGRFVVYVPEDPGTSDPALTLTLTWTMTFVPSSERHAASHVK